MEQCDAQLSTEHIRALEHCCAATTDIVTQFNNHTLHNQVFIHSYYMFVRITSTYSSNDALQLLQAVEHKLQRALDNVRSYNNNISNSNNNTTTSNTNNNISSNNSISSSNNNNTSAANTKQDPNVPKPNQSAYMLWHAATRSSFRRRRIDVIGVVGRTAEEVWRRMGAAEKEVWCCYYYYYYYYCVMLCYLLLCLCHRYNMYVVSTTIILLEMGQSSRSRQETKRT